VEEWVRVEVEEGMGVRLGVEVGVQVRVRVVEVVEVGMGVRVVKVVEVVEVVRCPVSGVGSQVSGIRCQVSMCQVSGVR